MENFVPKLPVLHHGTPLCIQLGMLSTVPQHERNHDLLCSPTSKVDILTVAEIATLPELSLPPPE